MMNIICSATIFIILFARKRNKLPSINNGTQIYKTEQERIPINCGILLGTKIIQEVIFLNLIAPGGLF
jgi:hypothetical protein